MGTFINDIIRRIFEMLYLLENWHPFYDNLWIVASCFIVIFCFMFISSDLFSSKTVYKVKKSVTIFKRLWVIRSVAHRIKETKSFEKYVYHIFIMILRNVVEWNLYTRHGQLLHNIFATMFVDNWWCKYYYKSNGRNEMKSIYSKPRDKTVLQIHPVITHEQFTSFVPRRSFEPISSLWLAEKSWNLSAE